MKIRSNILLIISFVTLLSCGANSGKKVEPVAFPQVKIPVYINDQDQAINFLAKNYWNNFFTLLHADDVQGTSVRGVDSVGFETAFGTYARILTMSDADVMDNSVRSLFMNLDSLARNGEKKPLLRIMSLMEHYFYNPISPVLDEEIYLSALNGILAAESLSELDKMQYVYQHRICALNRVGTKAADFKFREMLSGGKFRDRDLYGVKGNFTLLFFNNPDCNSCAEILEVIKNSPLEDLVSSGELRVLAMYIDEDLAAWKSNRAKYPQEWIYAHDAQLVLRNNGVYGLRAIPSLYLLDKEKRVILKDAPVEKVISYFMQR